MTARFIARRPLAVAVGGVLVAALCGLLAASKLGFKTARIELVGDVPFARQYLKVEQEFGDLNAILVAVEAPDPASARRYARVLAKRVQSDTRAFKGVFYRVSPEELGGEALLYLTHKELRAVETRLTRLVPGLKHGALLGSLRGFERELAARLDAGERGGAGDAALGGIAARILVDARRTLGGEPIPTSALAELPGWDTEGYVWTADKKRLVLLVDFQAEQTSNDELDPKTHSVRTLRALVKELKRTYPKVEVGLTGKPVLDVDELKTYQDDSLRASLVALVGVTLLVMLAFRRFLGPALIGGCLALALISTLGLAALWPGHLNLMAAVFVIVVIGVGVDFGIHLVSRYDQERADGAGPGDALERAFAHTGPAILAGALTTAGAFVVALLTSFQGLREFGVIAAMGVLSAAVVMLTVLPALLVRLDNRGERPRTGSGRLLAGIDHLAQERPRSLLAALVVLTLIAVNLAPRLGYDANLLALQDPNVASVRLEKELLADQQLSGSFLAVTTRDLGELAALSSRAAALPSVRRVESVLDHLPPDQPTRLPLVRAIQARLRVGLADLQQAPAPTSDTLSEAAEALLETLESALEQAIGDRDASKGIERLIQLTEALLEQGGKADDLTALLDYDRALRSDLARRLKLLSARDAEPLTPARLPPAFKDRFVGSGGSYMLRIYTKADLWEPREALPVIAKVRAALPDVTGVPVLLHGSSHLMAQSYLRAGLYAFVVVVVFMLLHFRQLGPTLLALTSLAIGGVWTAGALALAGIDLNPANLVALPLLLGVGIDTSVHVIHRLRETGPDAPLAASSLGRAVVYSGLTTVAGFGSLLLATHPGTASIGSTISIGVLCCVVAGLTVPTALTQLLRPRGA